VPGSFFEADLPMADVVLMGHILHDWDLATKRMLIETPGGFDYTGADCAGWMREAGFSSTRVERLMGPDSMVIAIKFSPPAPLPPAAAPAAPERIHCSCGC
jgi:hypothetical protein